MTNVHCHPTEAARGGTINDATMAPAPTPLMKMPVANARSDGPNHSDTALDAAGKFAASVSARKKRATPKPNADRASACAISTSDQATTAIENDSFVPMRSMIRPEISIIAAYATWKAMTMRPYSSSDQPISLCSCGARMLKT